MGRLGFKTEVPEGQRDTVDILRELVDTEIRANAPIEFYDTLTHMADASNSTSGYTKSQIKRFGSADNSAALLTTSFDHFDPKSLLSQVGGHA